MQLKREWQFLRGLLRTLGRVKSIAADSTNLICDDLEAAVDKWSSRTAIVCEGRGVTYAEMDAIANRYAHWGRAQGLRRGQTVALVMANRIEYLPIWYGLSKIGVATALINNNLAGAQLAHCLAISGAAHVIVDGDTAAPFEMVRASLEKPMTAWSLAPPHGEQRDLTAALRSCSQLRPDRGLREDITAKDTALYIYTSGTTGMPKAARVTHTRVQLYMRGFAGSTGSNEDDRIYVTLPLYHATGGLCAMGAALLNGGTAILRRKFSASHFWSDINEHGCTMFVYIGELCRYLVNQPANPAVERQTKLRMIFGNGLRPDVWEKMLERFRIDTVLEFYGSTEGNVSLFNFDGKLGAVGRVPRYLRSRFNIRIVKFDIETEQPIRGPDGFCIEAGPDEAGECIGHIGADARSSYTGYADKAASEKKILHDVFAKGDAWFRTGDLMRMDGDGYLYFVDRIGDTFRWKGENVSTGEVSERLSGVAGVKEANVYGVRIGDLDGRAGMASLVVDDAFDIDALAAYVDAELPVYARPLFVRLKREIETTGTFKYRKIDLVEDGFDPAKVKEPLFFKDPAKGYVKLTKAVFEKIGAGGYKL